MSDKELVRSLLGVQEKEYKPLMFTWSDHQRLRTVYFCLRDEFLLHRTAKDPSEDVYDLINAKCLHVREIVHAIKSTRNAIDAFKKPVVKSEAQGKPAEMSDATAFLLGLSDLEIQLVAWDVLARVCYACQGIHVMQSYGGGWEQLTSQAEERLSFNAHLRHILWVLRRSKMVCYQFCERSTWLDRLAMRPRAEVAMFSSLMAHEKGPKMCRQRCAEWEQAMRIRPNTSKRRLGKMSSEDIREEVPEIFSTIRRRWTKRQLDEKDPKNGSATKRRRLNSVAQSEGTALRQIEEAAVNSKTKKQKFRSSAPERIHTTLETMTGVPDFEELNPKVIDHRGTVALDKMRARERMKPTDGIDPVLLVSKQHTF